MGNKEMKEDFKDYLLFEKGLAENTIKSYDLDLDLFFKFFDKKNYDEIREKDILSYVEDMKTKYKSRTIYRKITTLKVFYEFLFKNSLVDDIPTKNLKNIKKGKYIPEVLSVQEIKDIIDATDNSFKGKRDRIVIKLLVATGGRITEILDLQIKDMDENFEFLRILGKGSKVRVVPLYEKIQEELRFYIENIRKKVIKDSNEQEIFPGLSRQNFWRRLKIYAKKARIKKNVYPHIFRHTVATQMLENGADIRIVQEILGHSKIATTQIYTHLTKRKIKSKYNEVGIGD
ncbi:MAG: tyrosine-type recombinase/integrase [Fusobacteriota bacterium]